MKTNKFLLSMLLIGAIWITTSGIFQEKKSYTMVELTYMLPKIGMEKAFVKAIKEHNLKYHSKIKVLYIKLLPVRMLDGMYKQWTNHV